MRAFRLRSTLLPLCAALLLPIAACGDDSTPGSDTTDTVQPDTTDTVQPDTTDTVQPDTTDTVQPDTTDTVQPDTTDTVQPDTTDTTEPDTTDTTEPDTTDTTEPDTTDTTEPDTTDTTEPDTTDTTDTTEPDTTPSSLATLVAPFAGSANNFETTPNASVVGLVVTLVKPNVGTELGGFFAIDPSDDTPIFFAPAAGAAGVPAAGSTIAVKVDTIKNVSGVPMVTAFSNLNVTSTGADLDALAANIDAWTAAEYADSQSTYFDLTAIISGAPSGAGGGAQGYQKFGFTSDGLTAPNPKVQLRVPAQIISALAIESGCIVTISGGAVWGFRTNESGATIEYQPMVVDSANLTVLCDAPMLTGATTNGDTTVVITFSRPLDPTTVEPAAFTFAPALTVNAVALSENGKTVTLTTATHAAASYTVSVDETVTDILGEPIDPDADTFTFDTGNVASVVLVGWNFGTASGTLSATSGIAANASKTFATTATGSLTYPSGYVGAGLAASSTGWDDGAGTKAWVANFATSGYSNIVIATSRHGGSGTAPRDWKLQYSLNNTSWTDVESGAYTLTAAVSPGTAATWFSFVDFALPTALDDQANVYLRWVVTSTTSINPGTVAITGTNRIDEVVIKGVPLP